MPYIDLMYDNLSRLDGSIWMESWIADGVRMECAMKKFSAYAHLAYKIVATVVMLERAIIQGIEIVSKIANCTGGRRNDNQLRVQFS